MKATLKLVMTGTGLVLIGAAIAAIVLLPNLEPLVRHRLEATLEKVFESDVAIHRISVSPLKQCVDLAGFRIDNPPGFKSGTAFECRRVRLEFDPTTLFAESPVIRSTNIEDAHIYYRYEAGEGVNISKLSDKAELYLALDDAPSFVMHEVICEDAEVHFSTNLIPKSRIGLRLIDVHLDDLHGDRAISAPKAAGIILRSIAREAITLRGMIGGSDEQGEIEPL